MIPGVDPRQLKSMMRQMGMSQEEVDAVEVIIKTPNYVYVFESPSVQKVTMQGQTTFQVMGNYRKEEVSAKVSISNEDVAMVADQAGVSKDKARVALEKVKGDIAEAIVSLSED